MMRPLSIFLLLIPAAVAAAADSIPSGTTTQRGIILGLRNGVIEIQDDRHTITRLAPNTPGPITLSAAPKVLDAENAYLDRQYKSAITLYTQALRDIDDPNLQAMVQLRLMRALDADGQLTEATRLYLQIYTAQPAELIATLHPSNLPQAGSKALTQAAALVDRTLHAGKLTAAQMRPLKLFLLDLYLKANDDRAAALAHELNGTAPVIAATTMPASPNAVDDALKPISAAMAAGHAAEAEKLAEALVDSKTTAVAAQATFLKAQALQAQAKYDDACLAYLMAASAFPKDAVAPKALLAAANLQATQRHEPQEALRLAQRIVQGYPNSPEALTAAQMISQKSAP